MKRPYIISHMMMSVDGRIDCPMVAKISGDEYSNALDNSTRTLRVTLLEHFE